MDLKDLMKKKGKDEAMDPKYKSAKMGVLKDISDLASKHMGDDIRGLKKVSVISPDKEGLKLGLHKAEGMIDEATENKYDKEDKHDPELAHDADAEAHDEHDYEASGEHGYKPHSQHDGLETTGGDEKKKNADSYDNEEVEAAIGRYLENPSPETLAALMACGKKEEQEEASE